MAGEVPGSDLSSERESLYEMLFLNSFDGFLLTSPEGSILDANPAACRIFGRTREEILRAGRDGLADSSDPRLSELLAERKRNGRAHGEVMARHKDGRLFPIEVSSVIFQSRTGETRTCMVIRDISQRKAAESERDELIRELSDASTRLNHLSGLLPMCASCRKIRDREGGWQDLESYIRQHTEADFTHGICPECRRRLYPETVGL
jgi:PAS domain S-box-containing protein